MRMLGTTAGIVSSVGSGKKEKRAQYGVPPVGVKVFVRVNQVLDGCEDLGVTFSGIVPASV